MFDTPSQSDLGIMSLGTAFGLVIAFVITNFQTPLLLAVALGFFVFGMLLLAERRQRTN